MRRGSWNPNWGHEVKQIQQRTCNINRERQCRAATKFILWRLISRQRKSMSNVKNDLSPATAILSGGKLCQRLFSVSPYCHKLITICSFCTFLSFCWKEMLPTILLGFLLYTSHTVVWISEFCKKKAAYLPSKCPHDSQYLLISTASLIFNFWDFPETRGSKKKKNRAKAQEHTYILT